MKLLPSSSSLSSLRARASILLSTLVIMISTLLLVSLPFSSHQNNNNQQQQPSSLPFVSAFLWFPVGFRYQASDIENCQPARCGFNATNTFTGQPNFTNLELLDPAIDFGNLSVTLPEEYDFHTCYNKYRETGPRYKQCRCFLRMSDCLRHEEYGNCTARLARQTCFEFWSDTDVQCSFRLCLSAGRQSVAGVIMVIVMIVISSLFF